MRHEAIIYFDGPLSKWLRGGMQSLGRAVAEWPEPDHTEIVARKTFRWRWMAQVWAVGRLRGFSNLLMEIRPK